MYRRFRIHAYTFGEILTPALLGLLVYSFMLLMNEIFLIAERTLSQNLPLATALKLFALAIPSVLVLTIPMATLLGMPPLAVCRAFPSAPNRPLPTEMPYGTRPCS